MKTQIYVTPAVKGLIKIKRRAKNHLHTPRWLGMWCWNFKQIWPLVFWVHKKRDAWRNSDATKIPLSIRVGDKKQGTIFSGGDKAPETGAQHWKKMAKNTDFKCGPGTTLINCRLYMGGLWSQRQKKVFYFNNKCVPVLVGPRHFPGYIESNMWSRHHKNSIPYFKGLPKHLVWHFLNILKMFLCLLGRPTLD